jgi:hypothetical protein
MFVQTLLPQKCNKYYIFCVCVFVALIMQCAYGILYWHMWPVWLYNIFLSHLKNTTFLWGGGDITEHKMCFLIFSTTFV